MRPLPHPDPGLVPHEANTDLAREVAVREVELRVLRAEVSTKELEVSDLRDRLRDVCAKLEDASGDVDTMSVKVETLAGNRHAVLKASCVQISDKVGALNKRLTQAEAELGEKDLEIQILLQAVADDEQRCRLQEQQLGDLHMGHAEQGQKARWLAEHQHGLKRKAAIDVWHDGVQAHIERERADIVLQRQRQVASEQIDSLSKESASMRSFINNLERTSMLNVRGIEEARKRYDELVMQARLQESAAKIGHETAYEQTQSQLAELHGLEARLAQADARKNRARHAEQAYSQHEVVAMRHMNELMALTECLREVTSVLHESGLSMHRDPIQRAVDEEIRLLHHIEDEKMPGGPKLAAPGPLFAPGGVSVPGPPRARSASPGPPWVEAAAGPPSPWSMGMGRPRLPSTPRSRSPVATFAAGPPVVMQADPSSTGPRSWGMPALVAPIAIGGAGEHLMAAQPAW